MPELPEVETVRRSLLPVLKGALLTSVIAYREGLRIPFPDFTPVLGCDVLDVQRRSKYLLIQFLPGALLIHLGMSGSLGWAMRDRGKHDHLDMVFKTALGSKTLRLHDPRRFGSVIFQPRGQQHKVLSKLGPEPLEESFTGPIFSDRIANRRQPIKVALMDPSIVVGVGNIYATEALFRSHLDPRRPSNQITLVESQELVKNVKDVLNEGIARGGSTLRDFHGVSGEVGTFPSTFQAYGRYNKPCVVCGNDLSQIRLGGRASVYCSTCQH